ncbi:hypothetical protein Q5H93_02340 [Hymenobacter sp. ASUV-10]|uniref:DUF3592 domain-containing protein n=1 Tax=Hymenobacter aranciens TaxID=3063996 RepID=A0ABT9B5M1_9BACT|nr:hypothetical protein [Hymenobacter sp. ASUV-10]MDO7873555.1 hypothetical protein [Hymenobacter sp. ASUV-10]
MLPTSVRNALGYGAICAMVLSFVWLILVSPRLAAHRSLDNLSRTDGVIDTVTIQRTATKDHSFYLAITLKHNFHWFGIKEHGDDEFPLDSLLHRLRPNQPLTVYYDPDWKIPGLKNDSEFDVYQAESTGHIVYSLKKTHQRYFELAKSGGIYILWLLGISIFHYFYRRRANF